MPCSAARTFALAAAVAALALLGGCGGADSSAPPATLSQESSALHARPLAAASAPPLTLTELLDWAENIYPNWFPSAHKVDGAEGPYTYRYYADSGNYAGIDNAADPGVYLMGPVTQGQLQRLGTVQDFRCTVMPGLCGLPLPVYRTGYENKNYLVLDRPQVPEIWTIPTLVPEPGEQNISPRSVAFADMARDGTIAAVTVTTIWRDVYHDGSNPYKASDSPAKVYVLQRDASGVWMDATSKFIPAGANRSICVSPGFINVADLNNDGRPDFFISCTGPDFVIQSLGRFDDLSAQYVVLSQPDGSYRVQDAGVGLIWGHQAALADVDGDGNIDVLTIVGSGHRPAVLWGHGDGTFSAPDGSLFPQDMDSKAIYGIVAAPLNGVLNVFVSGIPAASVPTPSQDNYGTRVLQFSQGKFVYVADLTPGIPLIPGSSLGWGLMLDLVYKDGAYYSVRVSADYSKQAVIRTDPQTGASTVVHQLTQGAGASMLKVTRQHTLVHEMGACRDGVTSVNFFYEACTMEVPLP